MAKLVFGAPAKKVGRAGVEGGVLYRQSDTGKFDKAEVWDGLTAVNTAPEGGEAQDFWADNTKFLTLRGAENFKFTIEAYTFPESFTECDGTKQVDAQLKGVYADGQDRVPFCFAWTTLLTNAEKGTSYGKEIHVAYLASAAPSSQDNATLNDSPELKQFSWECSSTPVPVPGMKPSAKLTFNSTVMDTKVFEALEGILFGTGAKDAHCPLPEELIPELKKALTPGG